MNSNNYPHIVGRLLGALLAISISACTSAGTDVTSLVKNVKFFKLNSNEIRITHLNQLNNILLQGDCNIMNEGFEYDLTNGATEAWTPVPSVPDSIITAIDNQCASNSRVSLTLDLSTVPPFSTMGLGDSYVVKLRDINKVDFSHTETFRVVFSNFNLASNRLIFGQGPNTSSCSGGYCLKGRVLGLSDLGTHTPSPTYTLKGKVIFK